MTEEQQRRPTHIKLTSHPCSHSEAASPIVWGDPDPQVRGPIIAGFGDVTQRNVIGTHSGSYAVYRALAVAAGTLAPAHKPDLTDTAPAVEIAATAAWGNSEKIASLDPFGHITSQVFARYIEEGYDVRPTIAITKAHVQMPEIVEAVQSGRLKPDGKILKANGETVVTKAAIEPVWYLPVIAQRFGCSESDLRRSLFEHTGGMFSELITRPDLNVFLPPIGGLTIYLFGDIAAIQDETREVACRVHDECNGSDVFGSDICTCRPYLAHGVEVCIEAAQRNGCGIIIYNRKEGRALGEVTKFLVYNARKRQEGGDSADTYFHRTECIAGVQDMRFQELMSDPLHWLGVTTIDKFVSMSNMKYDALVKSGITIKERVSIPENLIPEDAQVEMDAKKAAGYYTPTAVPDSNELKQAKGRALDD